MRKLLAFSAALVGALAIGLAPAGAITNGTPDVNDEYSHVGIMVAFIDGIPQWRCSGTLLSPTVYLTAGHCTDGADHVEVWFRSGYPTQIAPVPDGYPFDGEAGGTPYVHPDFDPSAFFLHDLGVVVLSTPVASSEFGALPSEGELSELPKHASLTAVGYGLQRSFPDPASWKDEAVRTRMIAHPRIMGIDDKQVGDFAILISHDASRGGTCFGDSGGPNFIGDSNVVGAVTSFGTTSTCKGHNGAYRVDQADDLDWLDEEFGELLP